jgi:multiple sugar transport system ATP-binding protein
MPSRERGVAMVFQTYALYPHMTVRQNLVFSLKLAGLPKGEIDRRVAEVSRILELTPYLDRKPANLSGGQRQRVAMGRAIVREPQVFLFDEPLSNLDAKLRNQMRVEIKRLQRRLKVTTVYVTHDQIEAMTLADVIVVMNDGRIAQAGTPIEVFENPADLFVAGFIGTPQMNFIEGELLQESDGFEFRGGGFHIPIDRRRLKEQLTPGQRVTAGIRPEDIVPEDHGAKPLNSVPFAAGVNLTEMLGNETLLFLTAGGQELIARMQQPRYVEQDEVLRFNLNIDRVHLFDRETGKSLRREQAQPVLRVYEGTNVRSAIGRDR